MPEPAATLSLLHESRVREAQLLADMLRISRLTVLYGASSSGKTTLLTTGVLPLLRRRATDRKPAQAGEPRVVIPFPHCRRTDSAARAEVALFFDEWDGLPVMRLSTWLLSALPDGAGSQLGAPFPSLAENLALWSRELGVRFLILLDQFEQFLTASRKRPGVAEFDEEFARVLGDPRIPVNFLVSVREDAEPLMERLRATMTGLGDASLRLYPLDMPRAASMQPRPESLRAAMAPTFVGSPSPATLDRAEEAVAEPPAPAESEIVVEREAIAEAAAANEVVVEQEAAAEAVAANEIVVEQEAVAEAAAAKEVVVAPEAMAEATVANEALLDSEAFRGEPSEAPAAAFERAAASEEPVLPAAAGNVTPAESAALDEQPPVETAAEARASARSWMPFLKWAAASGAFVALLFMIWAAQHFPAEPLPLRAAPELQTDAAPGPATTPEPQPAVPNLPPVALSIEPGNSTDAEIARDLASLVAADAGARIAVRQENDAAANDDTPQLAIMRYEALDAAARSKARVTGATDQLRIVTPLYTEEIYVIVRRDSPLAFIHEIRDTRINVGPERSHRALTASRLYERMFGVAMQPTNVSTLGDDEALAKLVKDKSIDAMLVVAGQPAKWLKDLPPDSAHSIKLLRLDRTHPIGQKAIEAYLPTSVRATSYGKWLAEDVPSLATMSFLVTPETSNAEAAQRLDAFLRAMCKNVATLRQQGHPKWREVQLGLELETGWPYLPAARDAFSPCLAR